MARRSTTNGAPPTKMISFAIPNMNILAEHGGNLALGTGEETTERETAVPRCHLKTVKSGNAFFFFFLSSKS
jgi:hypothetical protein